MKRLVLSFFLMYTIFEANAAITLSEVHLNVSCYGLCNGLISVTATGGVTPYNYSGLPSGPVCPGTYTITVTDAVGQTASISVTITEPPLLVATASSTDASCNSVCDGSASIIVTGGTGPYTYSWCDGTTGSSGINFCPGSCPVTVTDANGCQAIDTVVINEPAPINYSIVVTNSISCSGSCDGTICCTAVTGGTSPYSYLWTPSGTTASCMFGVCAGIYTLCVTDVNGCMACSTLVVSAPPPIQVIETITDASCSSCCDGSIQLSPNTGIPPFTYDWFPGSPIGDGTPMISSLCPLNYSYCVTDANGCQLCDSVTISFPLEIDDSEFDDSYNIFPNPANDFIDLETVEITDISVFDAIGKLILKEKVIQNKTRIDISDFPNGIYFIQLQSANKIVSKKFIKE